MMQVGKAVGMVALNDALMELVTKKLVAPEEAYAKASTRRGSKDSQARGDRDQDARRRLCACA